jgi:nicotinamidase/pyrazinamidase
MRRLGFAVEMRGDLTRAIDLNGSLDAARAGMADAGAVLL